ncbi:MAG: mechanosensitive ion channel family protein [Streptosporangiaceae bacterium]|nr:hypothetical protein [Actinomycetota bacterium]
MDLQERRQLDMAGQLARVKRRTRPWRSIFALALALAAVVAQVVWGLPLTVKHHGDYSDSRIFTAHAITVSCTVAFLVFGLAATLGLSGKAKELLEPTIGAAHAGVVRYFLLLVGVFLVLVVACELAGWPISRLVTAGAVTGVLLGIAAQQSLANLFAGLVLLFARPFRVGDRVRFRAGALSGQIEGTVVDISLTYVRLQTADGPMLLPNSQVLAASVGPLPDPEPPAAGDAASR